MFDKLKAVGALASLLKDKDKIQAAMERVKRVSEEVRAQGDAAGGAVRVTVNGQMKLLGVELAPALAAGIGADERTRELAGRAICDAANAAMASAQAKMRDVISKEMRELGLPEELEQFRGMLGG